MKVATAITSIVSCAALIVGGNASSNEKVSSSIVVYNMSHRKSPAFSAAAFYSDPLQQTHNTPIRSASNKRDQSARRLQTEGCILLLKKVLYEDHSEKEEVECFDATTIMIMSELMKDVKPEIIVVMMICRWK